MIRDASGFTLIEVLVAISLMAVAILGLSSMGATTMKADTQSHHMSAATALAQAKLEQLRVLPRSHLAWTAGSHSETGLWEDGSSGGPYTRQWQVVRKYNGYSGLDRVTVTVSWGNGAHSVSLASLFS
jgi:prepilin-type N-terminal cleavage/methylation domain-containing protein